MPRNEMVVRFEVALNIEKQVLTTSVHEKRNEFSNNLISHSYWSRKLVLILYWMSRSFVIMSTTLILFPGYI